MIDALIQEVELITPFDRTQPRTYQITVSGRLEPDWADYLGGLTITVDDRGPDITTTLSGELIDQAALMGVLNNLYGLGLLLLTVENQSVIYKENNYVGL